MAEELKMQLYKGRAWWCMRINKREEMIQSSTATHCLHRSDLPSPADTGTRTQRELRGTYHRWRRDWKHRRARLMEGWDGGRGYTMKSKISQIQVIGYNRQYSLNGIFSHQACLSIMCYWKISQFFAHTHEKKHESPPPTVGVDFGVLAHLCDRSCQSSPEDRRSSTHLARCSCRCLRWHKAGGDHSNSDLEETRRQKHTFRNTKIQITKCTDISTYRIATINRSCLN